jgi:aminomethyltransferase
VRMSGTGARDTLRLEAGICLYGNEISESTTPIEASLKWIIGKRRIMEKNFYGNEIILKQLNEGTSINRIGFIANEGPPIREGTLIYTDDSRQETAGRVTSGNFSPCLKKPIGMAYVNSNTQVYIIDNKDWICS